RGSGLLAAWIDDGHDGAGPRLRLVALDVAGKTTGDVRSIDVAATSLTRLALECLEEQCHLVFGGNVYGQAVLWATSVGPDQSLSTRELTTLTGSPTQQTMPVLAGGVVFVAVQSEQGQTLLRRLHVHWE